MEAEDKVGIEKECSFYLEKKNARFENFKISMTHIFVWKV
jgi:hypothetical protein